MISLILLVLAAICAALVALGQSIFEQGGLELVGWALLAYFLSILFGGVGPASPIRREA